MILNFFEKGILTVPKGLRFKEIQPTKRSEGPLVTSI